MACAVAINGLENPLYSFGTYSNKLANTQRTELTGMFITRILVHCAKKIPLQIILFY